MQGPTKCCGIGRKQSLLAVSFSELSPTLQGHISYLPLTSLSDTGELYVWGRNKHGQLASLAAFLPLPQRIEAHCFQDEKVTAVWSGWTHLVAKTGEGGTEYSGLLRVAVHSLVLGVEDSEGRGT